MKSLVLLTNDHLDSLSFFLAFLLVLHPAKTTALDSRGNETDRIALLAIKSQLIDQPGGVLSSWNHSLHHCHWQGVICGHRHSRVTVLNLNARKLLGTISPFIGNLTYLRQILLYHNNLYGQIPQEIGHLSGLRKLGLTNNSLSGEIPANLSSCRNLRYVYLGMNQLGGNLPMGLGALTQVIDFEVGVNHFTGPLFQVVTNFTSLEALYANFNAFTGSIPGTISGMTNLYILSVMENELSGVVPSSIFNLSAVQLLELGFNILQGSLPPDIGLTLPQIRILNLPQSSFSGQIPTSIANMTFLEYIDLSNNSITRGVLPDFGQLHNLWAILFSGNNLGGSIDFISSLVNCSNLQRLDLRGNDFTGVLPKSLVNLSNFEILLIGENHLTGEIPVGIDNLNNLALLYMDDNQFTGTIPHNLGKLHRIQDIALNSNGLTGGIPDYFRNLSRLSKLYLSGNKLQGIIPPTLGSCQSLLYLDLSYNDLNGTMPEELFGGVAKFLEVGLSQNQLEGTLPLELSQQRNLVSLDVSRNKFSGEIPHGLGNCFSLQYLNIEGNSFNGGLPPSFTSLRVLQEVDLSRNNLSGPIPNYFSRFPLLVYLNLSYNRFEGKVPTKGVFANASAISLVGNGNLCGGIPQLGLPICIKQGRNPRKEPPTLKVVIPIICALITMAFASWLCLTCHRKKRKSEPSGLLIREVFPKVSYKLLHEATDGCSSRNLLGAGTFGSVFKGTLVPSGMIVAIKVLNLQLQGAPKSFMAECKALRNIRHRNLVGIITACSSIDFQGNDFKALVYEFIPNGSLDKWLHHDGNLSLVQRVDIAIDVASALKYLHHDCQIPLVHCDIKPSNILVDEDMVARVGDFGLAKFVSQHQIPHQSSSIGIRGTIGYAAPEYGLGGKASTDGDIYSFGILLLEIMTGKRPTDNMFKEDFNLHMWAKAALPDEVLQIVDPNHTKHESENANGRCHTQATLQQQSVKCMIAVVKIGVSCSNHSPEDRMKMTDALRELQQAREVLSSARHRHSLH